MVDRISRDRLSELMRSYMDDQIDNIQFDETLHEIGGQTEDQTVRMAVRELWFHYDDCKEHFVVASKEQWGFFNRLLLLIASDAEIAVTTRRSWHPSQSIAAVSLILFVCLAILRGWGPDLIDLAFPFWHSQYGPRLVQQATKETGNRCGGRCCKSISEFQHSAICPAQGWRFRENQVSGRNRG